MYSFFSNLKRCVEEITEYSSTDSYIAQYILHNHEIIPNMTIFDIAKACNTSPSTITRFCKRVNNSSFKELKEDVIVYNEFLQDEINNRSVKSGKENRNSNSILNGYFKALNKSFVETKELIDEKKLIKAVHWIEEAKGIYVFGSSFSNIVAKNFSEKFTRLNKTAYSFPTLKSQILAIESMSEDDIAVIISFSGTTRHIKQINKLLKEKNIKIIWITSQNEIKNSFREIRLLVSTLKMEEFQTSIIQDHALNSIVDILYIYYVYLYTN